MDDISALQSRYVIHYQKPASVCQKHADNPQTPSRKSMLLSGIHH